MNTHYKAGQIQKAEEVENAVKNIEEFKDQLLFINDSYRNLIFFDPLKGITFKRSPRGEEDYFLYTGDGFTVSPNVSQKKLQLFRELRDQEYDKLQAEIKSIHDYRDRLKYVMAFGTFQLGRVIICHDFWSPKNPVPSSYIDVGPNNPDEHEIYNRLILGYIRESKIPGSIAEAHANSFTSFDQLKEAFEKQHKSLRKANIAAKNEILQLQKTLSFPDYSHEWRATQLYLSSPFNKAALNNVFNFLWAGYSIDYRVSIKLSDLFTIVQAEDYLQYYQYLVGGEYVLNKRQKVNEINVEDKTTMFEKWKVKESLEKREAHYKKVIEFLMEKNETIKNPFVKKIDGILCWVAPKVYAAAFIEWCRRNNCVESNLSALDAIIILNNTFTFSKGQISEKSQSEYTSKAVNEEYLYEFSVCPKK